ncbi:MAG: MoaD/ThiS family protein [Nitrososphaerales archaeon]
MNTLDSSEKDQAVRVTLHAEDLLPDQASPVVILDGPCTVGQAVRLLPLTRSTGLIILVNGKLAQWDTALREGDLIELIPVLGGG